MPCECYISIVNEAVNFHLLILIALIRIIHVTRNNEMCFVHPYNHTLILICRSFSLYAANNDDAMTIVIVGFIE